MLTFVASHGVDETEKEQGAEEGRSNGTNQRINL